MRDVRQIIINTVKAADNKAAFLDVLDSMVRVIRSPTEENYIKLLKNLTALAKYYNIDLLTAETVNDEFTIKDIGLLFSGRGAIYILPILAGKIIYKLKS